MSVAMDGRRTWHWSGPLVRIRSPRPLPDDRSKVMTAPAIVPYRIERMIATRVALALIMMTVGPLVARFTADAQPAPKVPRVGVFFASNPTVTTRNNEAFTQGLRERGYVEGQNIVLERRYGEARAERMAEIGRASCRERV